jgi:calcium-dependent protein kinase
MKKQIVHRDIKSENILFQDENSFNNIIVSIKNYNIKLIDFKTAVKFGGEGYLQKPVGSVLYKAPEVIGQRYNEKCDLGSYGVRACMILCGSILLAVTLIRK